MLCFVCRYSDACPSRPNPAVFSGYRDDGKRGGDFPARPDVRHATATLCRHIGAPRYEIQLFVLFEAIGGYRATGSKKNT
jgi:hypothetical protein